MWQCRSICQAMGSWVPTHSLLWYRSTTSNILLLGWHLLTKAMILRTSNPSNATSHISNRDWLKRKEEPGKTHRGRHQSKGLSLKDDAPPPSLLVTITRHAALLFSLLGSGGLRGAPHLTLANPMSSSRETEPPLWKLCWGHLCVRLD